MPCTDLKVISEANERALLTDVATASEGAVSSSPTPETNEAVAEIIRRILAGKNGLRH